MHTLAIGPRATIRLLTALLLVAAVGCAHRATDPRAAETEWKTIRLATASGYRVSSSDPTSDTLWILTCPNNVSVDAERPAILTRVATTGDAPKNFDVPGSCAGRSAKGVGLGLTVDARGNVWGLSGIDVFLFKSSSQQFLTFPVPVSDVRPGSDNPRAGIPGAISMAGSTLWVTLNGSSILQGLDTETQQWRGLSLGSMVPDEGTIAPLSENKIAVSGTILDSDAVGGALGIEIIDISTAAIIPTAIRSRGFAARPDGTLAYFDSSGNVKLYDPQTTLTSDVGVRMNAPAGVGSEHWRDTPPVAAPDGSLWASDVSRLADGTVVLVRIDTQKKSTTTFSLPVFRDAKNRWEGPGGGGLIFDRAGNPWVVNAILGEPGAQADLYGLSLSK